MEKEIKKNILQFELAANQVYETKQLEPDEEGELHFYVEALIATTDKDITNDVIQEKALVKAAETLKTKFQTVLFNHDKNRPIGKVVDAQVIDLDDSGNRKGLWVKILISKTENEIWQKIKEGVLSKFSFAAFATKEPVYIENEKGEKEISHYIITDLDIFECSLVSIPANPNAVALDYYIAKYLKDNLEEIEFEKNHFKEDDTMKEKIDELVTKAEKPKKPKITINNKDIDFTPWSQVNKIRLRNILFESSNKSAINEMYGVVRSYERMTDWGYPHHNLRSKGQNVYEMVLNYNGLMAAYKAMRGARGGGKNLTEEERKKLKSHLRRHFNKLISMGEYDEMPEGLKSLVTLINTYFDLEDKSDDKNLLKSIEEQIDMELEKLELQEKQANLEEDMEFKEANLDIEVDEIEKGKEKINEKEEEKSPQVEVTFDDLLKRIKEIVLEALEEYFGGEDWVDEEDIENEEDGEDEEKKAKEKNNKKSKPKKAEKIEELKEDKKETDVETEDILLNIISNIESKINEIEDKIQKLYEQPIVKGYDSQRDKVEEESLDAILTTEKFNQLPLKMQLDILRILMDKNLSEEIKVKKISNIIKEVPNNG